MNGESMADIFDKIAQGIDKGLTTVTARSKELIDTTKIKNQIKALQEQKSSVLEELGNMVYAMVLNDNLDQDKIKRTCEALSELDRQIKDNEEELIRIYEDTQRVLRGRMPVTVCDCGAELHEDVKFCRRCGKKTDSLSTRTTAAVGDITSPDTAQEGASCLHCGVKMSPIDKFCRSCGHAKA